MKTMINYFFLILAICSTQFAFAQSNVTFTKENFYDREDQLLDALQKMKEANKYYDAAEKRLPSALFSDDQVEALYSAALPLYLEANAFNPNNTQLNQRIGKCYIYLQRNKALPYIQKAMSLTLEIHPELYLLQAIAFQTMLQFDDAVESYKQYKNRLSPNGYKSYSATIEKRIMECNAAKEAVANPKDAFVDNLGLAINSSGPETNPQFSGDEKRMYFNRAVLTMKSTPEWNYSVLSSTKRGTTFSDPLIAESPNEGYTILYISENEDYVLFYAANKRKGEIYESFKRDGTWSKPKGVSGKVNACGSSEKSAFMSADGYRLFFSSNRSGGYGGYDIYYSERDYRGRWDKPVNIGAAINSEYDEHIVYVSSSGTTLYFVSQGHNTIGGFDIFQATWKNGEWGSVRNLGYPVNTPSDEVSFFPSSDGKEFYISSNRAGGQGSYDLYRVVAINTNKTVVSNYEDNLLAYHAQRIAEFVIQTTVQEKTAGSETIILNGVVTDEQKNPVKATVSIFNTRTGIEVAQFESNAATGQFALPIIVGANYAMLVMAPGYMFHSQNINVPYDTKATVINRYVELPKMEVDKSVALRNVFFDFGQAIPTAASFKELNVLYQMMVDQPEIKVEISGHTDNRGSARANKIMSERRAKAIVDFLIRNGIDPGRLSYIGYGFDSPIAPNTTVEGRSQNRRTEFKIISK
jgi:outer membrane protein OmpA-like peptidoglycan-associated protein/tetratricopeptide (TPR) repeat protein